MFLYKCVSILHLKMFGNQISHRNFVNKFYKFVQVCKKILKAINCFDIESQVLDYHYDDNHKYIYPIVSENNSYNKDSDNILMNESKIVLIPNSIQINIEKISQVYEMDIFLNQIIIRYTDIFYYIHNYCLHKLIQKKSKELQLPKLSQYLMDNTHIEFQDNIVSIETLIESNKIVSYSLKNVIIRLHRYNITIFSTYNLALLYLERFFNNYGLNHLDEDNFYMFFIIALMIACKYNDDESYNNYSFAYISGIPLPILNKLEVLFLNIIEHKLLFHMDDMAKIKNIVCLD